MSAGIYKQGQGYWTRMMSAVGVGLLGLMGGVWLWDQLKAINFEDQQTTIYVSAGGAVLFVAVVFGLAYWLIGRHGRTVDFMIATEGEMKKVNWSTRREIIGLTWVVIALTILIASLTGFFDFIFAAFFQWINVLEA